MENRKVIEWFEKRIAVMPESETKEMFCMAISALKKQSRIITVTDAEGGLIASISDKDIIEENGVHVIISEE